MNKRNELLKDIENAKEMYNIYIDILNEIKQNVDNIFMYEKILEYIESDNLTTIELKNEINNYLGINEKDVNIKFIKSIIGISLRAIGNKIGVDSSNVVNGSTTKENIETVANIIEEKVKEALNEKNTL